MFPVPRLVFTSGAFLLPQLAAAVKKISSLAVIAVDMSSIADIYSFPETSTGDGHERHPFKRKDLQGQGDERQVLLLVAQGSSLAAGRGFEGDAVSFVVDGDPTGNGNGDICVKTDKGRLVALVYANADLSPRSRVAIAIASALNAAFPDVCPTCKGLGEIGWFDHAEGAWRNEPCPETIHHADDTLNDIAAENEFATEEHFNTPSEGDDE